MSKTFEHKRGRIERNRGRRIHGFLENFEKAKSWLDKLGIPESKAGFLAAYFSLSLGGWTDTEAWTDAERLFPQHRAEEDSEDASDTLP